MTKTLQKWVDATIPERRDPVMDTSSHGGMNFAKTLDPVELDRIQSIYIDGLMEAKSISPIFNGGTGACPMPQRLEGMARTGTQHRTAHAGQRCTVSLQRPFTRRQSRRV